MNYYKRDNQRQRLYNAERDVSIWTYEGKMSLNDIDDWLTSIFKSNWFKNRHPRADSFIIHDGRSRRKAQGAAWGPVCHMWFPRWSRSQLVILHELAHGLSKLECGWYDHGEIFARIYVELVERFIGKEVSEELRHCYIKYRVKCSDMQLPSTKKKKFNFAECLDNYYREINET